MCEHDSYTSFILLLDVEIYCSLSINRVPFWQTFMNSLSLMKQQIVVTHSIRQNEIPALLDSWVTNTPSVKILHPQKIASPYIFVKKLCLDVSLLRICRDFSVSCTVSCVSMGNNKLLSHVLLNSLSFVHVISSLLIQIHLFMSLLSKDLKVKTPRNMILSAVLYGCETWCVTEGRI